MRDIPDDAEYEQLFAGDFPEGSCRAKALEYALDVRKFEIGLYWSRATYFWTLITAAFAGHAYVIDS
ncbi:MAG: hypothetical protein Q8O40_10115 [Chloroflexota bacterium]|nr:hypothetical protein [Chloroflexota bacterium]